jgi:hypothetical protein
MIGYESRTQAPTSPLLRELGVLLSQVNTPDTGSVDGRTAAPCQHLGVVRTPVSSKAGHVLIIMVTSIGRCQGVTSRATS